jgi:O-antigen/teichoic acid export membrane protein
LKSTKHNFIYSIVLTISNLLFPLLSFPYVSRVIGPEGIGKVQFLVTFSQYFVLVAALGIPIYGIREVAKLSGDKKKISKLFSELFFINLITSIILTTSYIVIVFSIDRFSEEKDLYLISGLLIVLGFTSIDWLYNGLEEFKFITIRSVLIKLISLAGLYVFVISKEDVLNYLILTIFSTVGNNIWNILSLRNKVAIQFSDINLKKHLPILLTLFSTSIATSIYTVMDTIILGLLTNNTTVGFYTAAIKLNKIAIPLVVSLGVVLFPKISRSISENNFVETQNLVNKSFHFVCLIGVPISVGLFIFAPEILFFFSGSEFIPATVTMQIASPIVFFIGLGHVFGLQILIPSHKEKYYLLATILGMFISLGCNFLFIVMFQDKGAAIATLIGELAVSYLSYYFVVKKLKYQFYWMNLVKATISSLTFIPIAYFARLVFIGMSFIELSVMLIMSVIIYFIFQLFLFKDSILIEILGVINNKINRKEVG